MKLTAVSLDSNVPDQNTEELREQRQRGLRALEKLGLIQIALGIATTTIGILALVFGIENGSNFPFILPLPIIAGILALSAGFLAYCSHKKVQNTDTNELLPAGKCMVIGSYAIFVTNITFDVLSAAFSVVGLVICNSSDLNEQVKCLPKQDEAVIVAALAIGAGVLVCLFSICGTCVFCCFGRAFGFKSRYERGVLEGMRIAQAQQQLPPPRRASLSLYSNQYNRNQSHTLQIAEPNYH